MSKKAPQTLRQALPGLRRILRRFSPHLRQERPLIVGAMAALVGGAALRLLEPWPLKFIFDAVIPPAAGAPARPSPLGLGTGALLAASAAALVAIVALRATCDYLNSVGFARIGNRVLLRVRNELFRHVQRLPLAFHTSARTGDMTIRVIGDVNMLRDAAVTAVLPLLANALVIAGMWAVMLWMQWRLALVAALALPPMWLWSTRSGRRIRDAARQQRQREGAMASTAAESLGAIRVVQALGLEERFAEAFLGRSREGQKQDVRMARLTARLERIVDVLLAVTTAAVLAYGASLILGGRLTPGELLVFLTYMRRAFNPVQDLAKYTGRLAKATAAGERVLDLLDRTPAEVHDRPGAVEAPPFRGHVRFEEVGFAYEEGRVALESVTFEAKPGEHVALVGPSGAGKSTIASLLLRLYEPTSGRVLIDGRDARDFTLASLRGQVGVVLQESVLFADTVRQNIACGGARGDVTPDEVEAAARLASAHEFIAALPQGYETVLGERGVTLSGGQRQRLALARAAVRPAAILLFDEPAAGLDEENERAVTDALRRLAQGRTAFYITHDLQLASRADRVLYVEAGRVVEQGTHAELTSRPTRYAALYALQAAGGGGPPAAPAPAPAGAPPSARGPHALAL